MLLVKGTGFRFGFVSALLLWGRFLAFGQSIYYVDPGHSESSDMNAGTEAAPWETMGKAASTVEAGDTVYVAPGLYREGLTFANGGREGAPIRVVALDATRRPVLDGSDVISGWTLLSNLVYVASLSERPSALYQGGSNKMAIAMQPNSVDPEDPYNHAVWYRVESNSVVVSGSTAESDMIAAGVEYLYLDPFFASVNGHAAPGAEGSARTVRHW
jgi:hypothetical protein